jgi:hypothetical protein
MSFRFKNLQGLGNRVSVTMPKDEGGFIGRECPATECLGYFKLKPGTGLVGTDLPCHCPYCGHTGSPKTFWTQEQIAYAKSVAFRQISEAIGKDLKQLERSGRGLSVRVTNKRLPGIKHFRDKKLETVVTCTECSLEYAIYGVFGYCPDCGAHNSAQILDRNFELVRKQVALAQSLEDDDLKRHLIEDALENCVSIFDGFGRETCRVRAGSSSNAEKASNVSFQNLGRAADKLQALFGVDFRAAVTGQEWEAAHRAFLKRHVLAHSAGVVDEQYLAGARDASAVIGRRVVVIAEDIHVLLLVLQTLATYLVGALPPPA